MKNILISALAFVMVSGAWAGSHTVICKNKSGSIVLGVGNRSDNNITIKYIGEDKKEKVAVADAGLLPDMAYNASESAVTVFPVGKKTYIKVNHDRIHGFTNEGKPCLGRELWEDTYTQLFLITGNNGYGLQSLFNYTTPQISGYDAESGYVTETMTCTDEGASSPGGCFAQ